MDEDQVRLDPGIRRVALAGPDPELTHEEFMATLYPKVQEILKFLADKHVILEDPISSTGTLSSMKNLEDAYAIGDQLINDKSTEDEPGKLNVEAEVVSMQNNKNLNNTTRNLGSRVYTLELRDLPHKIDEAVRENVKEAVQIALQDPLRERFRDLFEEDMKEMLHQRMFESGTYKSLPEHIALYEALEASMARAQRDEFLVETNKSRKRCRDDQDPPPPPPDSDLSKRRRHDTGASGSSQPQAPHSSAWKKSDTRDAPSSSSKKQSGPRAEQPVEANALASTYQAPAENSLLEKTGDMRTFMNWYCQKVGKTELTQAYFEGQAYEVVKAFYPDVALSISKMKAARYHDFGLELLVPEHMWIDDVCTYDISASYGISHWWFNRQKFYIDRHTADSSRKAVRTHMRILSVVGIKAYSRYGYDYLKEITLRRADYQEYTIAEKDFKNLYPSDFEDLNLLLLQGHLNHLSGSDKRMLSTAVNLWTRNLVIRQRVEDLQLGIESYQKQLNLTKPGWDATGYEYKHDYTIIESPRAVVFPVSNNERKIMRFNEIYKFSDGTLTNILEALHYRVKEYKVNRFNPGKLGDSDVHTLEDPTLILEILSRRFFLRLNLPDHRSVLTGSGGSSKDGDGDTSIKVKGTSRTTNNQAFTIKKGMSMPVQMSQAQDGERPQTDDQRLDLADDLKEAQDLISHSITSHKTNITTSKYKILREELKTTS
ncbi:hypothetical protein Tco_1112637 [Tanacetum coccineum]|uniref:Uncharacterized protein n=1 Tax=Tanacetum coccineum TaxID=301880 RepID=A0ABQ5IQ63_9ASTR